VSLSIVVTLVLPTTAASQMTDPLVNMNFIVDTSPVVECGTFQWIMPDQCEDLGNDGFIHWAYAIGIYVSREGGWPNGIGGLQFGIEYEIDGGDVVAWMHCAGGTDIPDPNWPASGTGIALTFLGGCHVPDAEVALVGVILIMGSGDVSGDFRLTPDPRIGMALVADCNPTSYEICQPNLASWSLGTDVVPVCGNHCGGTPVEETSWGRIKSQYR
jgi:hypothetical protein